MLHAKCKSANSKAWLATGEKKTATAKHDYGCAVDLSVSQYVHEVRPVRVHKHVRTNNDRTHIIIISRNQLFSFNLWKYVLALPSIIYTLAIEQVQIHTQVSA